jgi:cytochrome P450
MPIDATGVSAASGPVPAPQASAGTPHLDFDMNDLKSGGPFDKVGEWLFDYPRCQCWMGFLRLFWPIPAIRPLLKWAVATRFDDVQEVLTQDQIFQVPFGKRIIELNAGGPNFVLGMQDGEEYRTNLRQIMEAFRIEDVSTLVAPMATAFAEKLISESKGRLDAVEGLITLVCTMVCEKYFGIAIPHKKDFAYWTLAMSKYLFGDLTNNAGIQRAARAGAECVRTVIDDAIAAERARNCRSSTVLARLLQMQDRDPTTLPDTVIRAHFLGMITGFIPTNATAGGHMLEMLLRRRDFMAPTRTAALAGDDDLLMCCLFEAMRFKPLNPGPVRCCTRDYTFAKRGFMSWRPQTIRQGMKVLASTQSAMFDPRRVKRPHDFDPQRPAYNYMLLGYGLHWCAGAFIAKAQIARTFKALLVKNGLRRAAGRDGKLEQLGGIPIHLWVEFEG